MFKLNACLFVKAFGFNFLNLPEAKLGMLHELAFLKGIGVAGLEVGTWRMQYHGWRQPVFRLLFDANKTCAAGRTLLAKCTGKFPGGCDALVDLDQGGVDFL